MHERIKNLRKNHLHLSQTELGERLGVSRSVINNIERNALARPEQKLSLIKLMCSIFDVNEEWLLHGTEPIFIKTPSSTMEQLRKEFNLDDFSYNLVYEYLKLDVEQRDAFREFFYRVIHTEDNMVSTTADAEAAYEKSLGIASSTDSTALSTTDGTGENENRDVG